MPRQHRSRSSGYVDQLEEHARRDRRERELQMRRYHENSRHSSTAYHIIKSDHLCVPVFETARQPRDSEQVEQRRESQSPRSFRVEEVRPGPRPAYNYNLNTEPVLPSQSPTKHEWKPHQHSSKPKIKVQIIQDHPPIFDKTSARTPKRSPSASPKSSTAQPELPFQYSTLQVKLAQICAVCLPFKDVEPADPRDLTFEKIAAQVEGFGFDLRIWSQVANVNGLAMVEKSKRNVANAASRNLARLIVRVSELHDACAAAKPRDLKLPSLPTVTDKEDEEELYDDDESEDDANIDDPTESPGFVIHSLLHSIEVQIQTLKRLSRSLQEATPDAKDEVVNVTRLVDETAQYFGSNTALQLHLIDSRLSGRKALVAARRACRIV
ncbi:hypothetical protein ST47_g3840 [Ascochyta rabiei]|uniref:Uncharacterized protein n=2 Tax=Didymella rabiei TaxID=5454 RepID=A0A163GSU5_DIDRA|nr:hypothetical protein ST47_g3840 [Ascochyta rabiei]